MKAQALDVANRALTSVFGERIGVYNGVAVRDRGLLDVVDRVPEYKGELVGAVRHAVSDGDEVVVVGGGRSVVAVHAARMGGRVTVYEADREQYDLARETARLNKTWLDIRHAVVGEPGHVDGDCSDVVVDPETLSGDVLVLDCEGAETDILPVDGFDIVIVETHPRFGAPTRAVVKHLDEPRVLGPDAVAGEVVVSD